MALWSGRAGNGWLLVVRRGRSLVVGLWSLATALANDGGANDQRLTTNRQRKLNILQVRASHSGGTHFGI